VDSGHSGELVEPADAFALASAILSWLAKPRSAIADACRAFASENGWDAFERRLMQALA
jgi:glycosyltransferase involved in cell wall biosynthesis